MEKENERYRELAALAQMGWWEVNFTAEQCLCSDFLCDLFDLRESSISFSDFFQLIREDYREQIIQELRNYNLAHEDFYEQTFPVNY